MKNTTGLVLGCLSLLLVVFPLAVPTQGMPVTLKADEPAYYLAALSLVRDGDLVCDTHDVRRLFDAFPHLPVENLILMSRAEQVYFGKPVIYSVLAAPFAGLFGARGMVAFNMALFVGMVWMGYFYLRRRNPDGLAALFSVSFFVLSLAFVYVFWLHPETVSMFSVMACLYLAFTEESGGLRASRLSQWRSALLGGTSRIALSGAALSLAVYNKPMLAAIGVPALFFVARRRGLRSAAVWVVAASFALGAQAGVSQLLTETPTPYLGTSRTGFKIEDPEKFDAMVARFRQPVVSEATHSSYSWLARIPKLFPRMLLQNIGSFFVGRHTGIFVYGPFALVTLLLFLLNDRWRFERWLILAAMASVALFFLIWMHYNWHGGAGFVGNRYFVNLYPAFLFLATTVRPLWTSAVGFLGGALFLTPLLFAPFGAQVPDPTLQWHTRGAAYQLLPQELSIAAEVPGYVNFNTRGLTLRGRKDQFRISDRGAATFQVRGASRAEIWVQAARPIEELVLAVSSPVPNSTASVEFAGESRSIEFGETGSEAVEVALVPENARVRYQWDKKLYAYRLVVETDSGRNPRRADGEVIQPQFYVGAELAIRSVRRIAG